MCVVEPWSKNHTTTTAGNGLPAQYYAFAELMRQSATEKRNVGWRANYVAGWRRALIGRLVGWTDTDTDIDMWLLVHHTTTILAAGRPPPPMQLSIRVVVACVCACWSRSLLISRHIVAALTRAHFTCSSSTRRSSGSQRPAAYSLSICWAMMPLFPAPELLSGKRAMSLFRAKASRLVLVEADL
ncbi:unnamed protein product [Heligmosomoides polygyrus]|uniref:DUF5631 domain-containing protein n=1 Tax=Heligmosomoides polygyrus TaxID=6339 RepID=A0A183FEM1_HELPZ|nr:unnamed protein product [Heligmosomoides polygyrus]